MLCFPRVPVSGRKWHVYFRIRVHDYVSVTNVLLPYSLTAQALGSGSSGMHTPFQWCANSQAKALGRPSRYDDA